MDTNKYCFSLPTHRNFSFGKRQSANWTQYDFRNLLYLILTTLPSVANHHSTTTVCLIISIFHYFPDSRKPRNHHYSRVDDTTQFLTLLWFLLAMLAHQKALTFILSIMKNLPGTKGPQQHLMSLVVKSIVGSVLEGNNPHTLPKVWECPPL